MSRTLLAAVFLLAPIFARAQMEVRTATVLPPSAGMPVLAPSAMLAPSLAPALAPLSAPGLIASPLAAPSAPAPVPAVSAAPAAAAAAMSGALGEFGKIDLKTATAADARGAGDDLMLRALGAAPVEALPAAGEPLLSSLSVDAEGRLLASDGGSSSRSQPKIYLLSKPLRETVRLGPVSMVAHAVGALLWELAKATVAYKATGSFAAAATVFAFESLTSPVMLTARSLGDLGFRYWRRKLGVLKELARTPAVSRVKVLTTGDVSFWGPFARGKDNTGLIFVEAHDALPETMGRFGTPIPLGDVAATKVRLVFIQGGGQTSEVSWTPTLKELLEGKPIPPEIAKAWRGGSESVVPNPLKMIDVTGAKGKARLEATLIGADGTERDIGAISEGPAARALIGLGLIDRARAFLGRERPVRSIPISDSTIERRGDPREKGFVAALKRAWGRISGRLIVAHSTRDPGR